MRACAPPSCPDQNSPATNKTMIKSGANEKTVKYDRDALSLKTSLRIHESVASFKSCQIDAGDARRAGHTEGVVGADGFRDSLKGVRTHQVESDG